MPQLNKKTLNIYNKENLEKEKNDVEHGHYQSLFAEGIQLDDDQDEGGKIGSQDDKNRRRSIRLDDLEAPESEAKEEEVKIEKPKQIVEEKFSGEGFLYKKPPKKIRLNWYC